MGCLKINKQTTESQLKIAHKASREDKCEQGWYSVDPPALDGTYLDGQLNSGFFNPRNLSIYSYTYQNPIILTDPDGNSPKGAGIQPPTSYGRQYWMAKNPGVAVLEGFRQLLHGAGKALNVKVSTEVSAKAGKKISKGSVVIDARAEASTKVTVDSATFFDYHGENDASGNFDVETFLGIKAEVKSEKKIGPVTVEMTSEGNMKAEQTLKKLGPAEITAHGAYNTNTNEASAGISAKIKAESPRGLYIEASATTEIIKKIDNE